VFWRNRHDVSEEELNAYSDGSLASARAEQVRAHAETCSDCAEALIELGTLRSALGEMPSVHVPRSFALRQADVEAAPAVAPTAALGGVFGSLTPMLTGVAAIALVAFVVLAGVDLTSTSSENSNDSAAVAQTMSSERAAATGELAPAASGLGETDLSGDGDDAAPVPGVADAVPEPDVTIEAGDSNEYASLPNDDGDKGDIEAGAEAATVNSEDDDGNGLRIAEIVTAVAAISAGGAALYVWRRNRRLAV
jgi:Putative zinc-finger